MSERAVTRWARRVLPRRLGRRRSQPQRPADGAAYRGDFAGQVQITYAPNPNGVADPGEIVWAWVPFEEDNSRGKDRPVLILALHEADLLGLMLTSKDHDGRPDAESWFDLGTGAWDRQGRPSEVRLDRVLRLAPSAVRREGATLDKARFDLVVAAFRAQVSR